MTIRFQALPTDAVRELQHGAPDAYGMRPERRISDGVGVPCRHCLQNVGAGEPYLILAYRPFPELQPYAETGPIFLHAEECSRAEEGAELPDLFSKTRDYILRGYSADNCIVYGTGMVTETPEIVAKAQELLQQPDVAYVHMRSAKNNCYQCRIELA